MLPSTSSLSSTLPLWHPFIHFLSTKLLYSRLLSWWFPPSIDSKTKVKKSVKIFNELQRPRKTAYSLYDDGSADRAWKLAFWWARLRNYLQLRQGILLYRWCAISLCDSFWKQMTEEAEYLWRGRSKCRFSIAWTENHSTPSTSGSICPKAPWVEEDCMSLAATALVSPSYLWKMSKLLLFN